MPHLGIQTMLCSSAFIGCLPAYGGVPLPPQARKETRLQSFTTHAQNAATGVIVGIQQLYDALLRSKFLADTFESATNSCYITFYCNDKCFPGVWRSVDMDRLVKLVVFCLYSAVIASLCGCGDRSGDAGTEQAETTEPPLIALMNEGAMILGEAEDAVEITKPFVIGLDGRRNRTETKTASGGQYLEIPKGKGKGKDVGGKAVIKFNVEEEGEYIFHARIYALGACWNSFVIQVDDYVKMKRDKDKKGKPTGKEYIGAPELSTSTFENWHWEWLKGPSGKPLVFDLSKGEHTLIVHNSEDGVKMDQYIFTKETDPEEWYPAGIMTKD